MNKKDWIDYFKTIHGVEPSAEQILEAVDKGEIITSQANTNNSNQYVLPTNNSKKEHYDFLSVLKRIIFALDKKWLFRQYVITILMVILSIISEVLPLNLYIIMCMILNPWARFVWLGVNNFLFSDSGVFIFLPIYFMIAIKWAMYLLVLILSPILAPVGFIYLYFKTK